MGCLWEKPEEGSEPFCDNNASFRDFTGATCQDYVDKKYCENCETGSGWPRQRSGEWYDWAGNNCDKACGCCDGPSVADIIVADSVPVVQDEKTPEADDDAANVEDVKAETTPEPEASQAPADMCADVGEDDNTSRMRPYKNFDCAGLTWGCVTNEDIIGRCPKTCCEYHMQQMVGGVFASEVEQSQTDYLGYLAVFVISSALTAGMMTMCRNKHSDNYVALLENEI